MKEHFNLYIDKKGKLIEVAVFGNKEYKYRINGIADHPELGMYFRLIR